MDLKLRTDVRPGDADLPVPGKQTVFQVRESALPGRETARMKRGLEPGSEGPRCEGLSRSHPEKKGFPREEKEQPTQIQ